MNKNKSLVLALVGLAIVILVGVYVYQTEPFAEPERTETGGQAPANVEETAERNNEETRDTAESAAATSEPEAGEASGTAEAEQSPTFDVVRVEPDGSTLVAGQAEPGTKVQVVNNGQVIAEADAGVSGDFVVVVEDALKPGDHEIVLRSVGENDTAAQSEEVATISVPEDEPAELLVMVTKPGEASRILAKPEAETAATAAQEDERSEPAADTAMTKPARDADDEAADAGGQTGDDTASQTALADTGTVAAQPILRIDAVEIEGGRMFVAGSATPGADVSVYANGESLGTSRVSRNGRFLVEADKDIAVGDHTISADLTMRGNVAPALRVTVPFTRPEGEMVAAVAASEAGGGTAGEETADAGETSGREEVAQKPAGAENITTEMSATGEAGPVRDTGSGSEDAAVEETADAVADADGQPVVEEGSTDDTQSTPAPAAPAAGEAETVVQAALEPRDGSVIIRRGDTLWQISRRIYGRGVRYTTIYLANADQIKNPDLIEPGQVFAVPEEPLDNAEELHRQRIWGR